MQSFRSIVKDRDHHVRHLHINQRAEGTLGLPITVDRAQATRGAGEIEKLPANEGGLMSTNTFLSTTADCQVA